jgi:hypothetical protein
MTKREKNMNEPTKKCCERMNIFKTFTLKWWQGALFKWGVFLLGLAAGAYWHTFFYNFVPLLVIMSVPCLVYVTYLWWKQ